MQENLSLGVLEKVRLKVVRSAIEISWNIEILLVVHCKPPLLLIFNRLVSFKGDFRVNAIRPCMYIRSYNEYN